MDVAAVETNILLFNIAETGVSRGELLRRVAPSGVRFSPGLRPTLLRAVTHLDIPADGVAQALAAVREALAK